MPSFSTAGYNSSQLCTTQLCLLVAEAVLSQTRHEVKAELARTELIVMVIPVCLEMWCKCRCG